MTWYNISRYIYYNIVLARILYHKPSFYESYSISRINIIATKYYSNFTTYSISPNSFVPKTGRSWYFIFMSSSKSKKGVSFREGEPDLLVRTKSNNSTTTIQLQTTMRCYSLYCCCYTSYINCSSTLFPKYEASPFHQEVMKSDYYVVKRYK